MHPRLARLRAAAFALLLCGPAWAQGPAVTQGGAGGRVITVTSLADAGPGTLREALEAPGAREVRFAVGGEIWLDAPLRVREPRLTVAGETAPSPGISLMGDTLRIRASDVIVRHLRVRVGERPGSKPDNRDGIGIDGSQDGTRPVADVLIENCSVAWAVDENLVIWGRNSRNVVIRDSIVAEALRNSIHPKGSHSMGLLVGPGITEVRIERNLFAHNEFRNPVLHGGASAVVMNNLIYNPTHHGFHVYPHRSGGATLASVVGNVLIAGPSTKRRPLGTINKGANEGTQVYLIDNRAVGATSFDPSETHPKAPPGVFVDRAPIWFDDLKPWPAAAVEARVLAQAGARPWDRDATDRRIVEEVRMRGGAMRDAPTDSRLVNPDRPLKR